MSTLSVTPAYTALLARIPPHIIETEEQNEAYIEILYELDRDDASKEDQAFAALLTLLIEEFEEKHYSLPKASQAGMIDFLLDQRGETGDVLSSLNVQTDFKQVLSGEREMTSAEIREVSAYFHVSPEVFF